MIRLIVGFIAASTLLTSLAFGQGDQSLFPVSENRTWTYRETLLDGSPSHCSTDGHKTITARNIQGLADNQTVDMVAVPDCYPNFSWSYRITPSWVYVNGYHLLKFPPVEGDSWGAGGASGAVYRWSKHYDNLRIQNKTYQDCWELTVNNTSETFCRGVGMVKAVVGSWDQNMMLELISVQ